MTPGYSRKLVGERHRYGPPGAPSQKSLHPQRKRRGFVLKRAQQRGGPQHEQPAQSTVARFRDAPQPCLAAGPFEPWRKPNPRGKMAAVPEQLRIRNEYAPREIPPHWPQVRTGFPADQVYSQALESRTAYPRQVRLALAAVGGELASGCTSAHSALAPIGPTPGMPSRRWLCLLPLCQARSRFSRPSSFWLISAIAPIKAEVV